MPHAVATALHEATRPHGGHLELCEVVALGGRPCLGRTWSGAGPCPRRVGRPVSSVVRARDDDLVESFNAFVPQSEGRRGWYTWLHDGRSVAGLLSYTLPAGVGRPHLDTLRRTVADHLPDVLVQTSHHPSPFYALLGEQGEVVATSARHPVDAALLGEAAHHASDLGTEMVVRTVTGHFVELIPLAGRGLPQTLARFLPIARAALPTLARLSPTQALVCRYAAAGASTPEIGRALGRRAETVRSHLRSAYKRLGVGSRVELAGVAGELDAWGAA